MPETNSILAYLDTFLTAIVALVLGYFTYKSKIKEKETQREGSLREQLRAQEKLIVDQREETRTAELANIRISMENVHKLCNELEANSKQMLASLGTVDKKLTHVSKVSALLTEFAISASSTIITIGEVTSGLDLPDAAKEKLATKIAAFAESDRKLLSEVSSLNIKSE